jgi:two-component system, NarL family, response regulator
MSSHVNHEFRNLQKKLPEISKSFHCLIQDALTGFSCFMDPNGKKIRLLIADDHPITREGLALILSNQTDMTVVGQAGDGDEAFELYRKCLPDVSILDLQMPVMNGAQAAQKIIHEFKDAKILILSTYDGDEDVYRAMQAGAKGYLVKDSTRDEVLRAIRAVNNGFRFVSPGVGAKLADRMIAPSLTERELQVLRLVAGGKGNKEIAYEMGLSEGTVKSHVNAITSKLGVTSRTEAALVAHKRGLLRG